MINLYYWKEDWKTTTENVHWSIFLQWKLWSKFLRWKQHFSNIKMLKFLNIETIFLRNYLQIWIEWCWIKNKRCNISQVLDKKRLVLLFVVCRWDFIDSIYSKSMFSTHKWKAWDPKNSCKNIFQALNNVFANWKAVNLGKIFYLIC